MTNPFTKSLIANNTDPVLLHFVQQWDLLEALVVRVFRAKQATDADLAEWREIRQALLSALPRWRDRLAPHWPGLKIGGKPADTSPFESLLATVEATGIVGNLRAMQTLPAAREALNLMIVDAGRPASRVIDKLAWLETATLCFWPPDKSLG